MGDGREPIEDDELLYRRVPEHPPFYDPATDPKPTPQAFRPHRKDTAGLSVYRAKYKTPEQVAVNPRGKRYYVAVLRAGDLRDGGIEVVPRPESEDPGHAVLPQLTYENRQTDAAEEAAVLLAEKLCLEVKGPFPPAVSQEPCRDTPSCKEPDAGAE